ncbi:hypothetical protein B0T24DRAFT_270078 [Lasiosphaeria ovina]|uniref:Uncharacterized protein n=1 Tax=Lasiosphaeria ovina TaxID=92902 RepID=A0AAE0KCG8_9PEZI|nr:hypothetical protein B0T24DRAFT_270078 [Lasiosphaeria ovina]
MCDCTTIQPTDRFNRPINPPPTVKRSQSSWHDGRPQRRPYPPVRHRVGITRAEHHCATHVRISPVSGFSNPQLRQVTRGVLLFQDAISFILPPPHEANVYSRPASLPDSLLNRVDQLDITELIDTMMPTATPTQDPDAIWDRKYVAWNFLSIYRLGTVEWRQGPSCTSPNDAVRWSVLALSAVEVFLRADFEYLRRELARRPSAVLRARILRPLIIAASRNLCREDADLEIEAGDLD